MNPELDLRDVYAASAGRLVAQLYGVTGDYADAQDAVQEAFARALTRPAGLQRMDNPEAWLTPVPRAPPAGVAGAPSALLSSRWAWLPAAVRRSPSPPIGRPRRLRPAPSPSTGPWRTVVPQPGAQGPAPQPSYTEIEPGLFDPTARDKPLTGMFTELRAGDLDHLYLPYQDCAGKNCRQMLAASADRGRTWRKLPLPESEHKPIVTLVHGSLVLALESDSRPREGSYDPRSLPDPTYWSSTDGGVTWRRSAARTVEALPAG